MKAGKARSKRGGNRRGMVLTGAVIVVAAAAGISAYLVTRGSSSPAASPPPPLPAPLAALRTHQLLEPECKPLAGPRWSSPGNTLITSNLYEFFAINMPCAQAARLIGDMTRATVPVKHTGNISTLHGPAGWNCGGWPDRNRHAYAGGCRKGKQAFGWNWNVANRRVVFVPDETTGKLVMQKLAGTDAETIVRPLPNGHYELEVLNTSGVGYLDSFTWAPPGGLQVTKISKVANADCKLVVGKVSCVANLHPPGCLCDGSGGDLTMELTMEPRTTSKAPKYHVTYGTAGADFEITRMSPVPYLIPGTPQEAKRRGGL